MSDDPQHKATFGDTSLATCPKCGGLHMRVKGCQCDAAQQSTIRHDARDFQEGFRAMVARGLVSLAVAIMPECNTRRWLRDMRDIWRQRVREIARHG